MKLNVRIRTARLRAGLTQSDLAQRLGISRTAVVNWESASNRARPSSERLEEICRLTGVTWEWLATGRGRATMSTDIILAADAEFVEDPIERRVLQAYRSCNGTSKQALLALVEQLAHANR